MSRRVIVERVVVVVVVVVEWSVRMENGENAERWCIMAIDLSRYIQHRSCGEWGQSCHFILCTATWYGYI